MADTTATGLSAASALGDTDVFYVVQSGSKKATGVQLKTYLFGSAATFASTVTLNADPVSALQAATKQYVDNIAAGLDIKPSARVASTANLTLSGAQTIDGVSAIAGDRVVAKDQTAPAENGIYVVAAGAWARAADMDAWTEVPGANVWVEEGSTNADKAFVCTSNAGGTINTTAITWTQFGGTGAYQAASAVLTTLAGASANGQSLATAADYAAMRTLLGLVINTNVQAFNANLTAVVKNNFAATAAPALTDDSASGYAAGSRWKWAATGETWECRDATTNAAKWVKVGAPDHPGYVATYYYAPFPVGTFAAGGAPTANTIVMIPWMVVERCTVSSLLCRVTTLGTNTWLAIYASDKVTKRPTGTDVGHTALAGTATGSATTFDIALTANATLEPGLYWLAANQDNAAQVYQSASASGSTFLDTLIGSATIATVTPSSTGGLTYLKVAQATGTWPDMTSATINEGTDNKWALIYPHILTVP